MKRVPLLFTVCIVTAAVTGCSSNHVTKSVIAPVPQDGQIISLTPIKVPNASPVLEIYKMMYWSDEIKTEAYVAVPQQTGPYTLEVFCHGGYAVANRLTHASSPESVNDLANASPNFISLVPQYRGYADSEGTVHGLDGDTLDTNNAIKAVMSRFPVDPGGIYLKGVSMGGAVVLKLASERKDIQSVIAISPWVGWDIVGKWATENHAINSLAESWYYTMTGNYGSYNPTSPVFEDESINYKDIHAPTLLLQGTADEIVPWQTVQMLYNDMKPFNANVKFKLIPGGDHGLKNKEELLGEDINQWANIYGIYGSYYGYKY